MKNNKGVKKFISKWRNLWFNCNYGPFNSFVIFDFLDNLLGREASIKIAIINNLIAVFRYFIAKNRYYIVIFSYYIAIYHYFIAEFSYFCVDLINQYIK